MFAGTLFSGRFAGRSRGASSDADTRKSAQHETKKKQISFGVDNISSLTEYIKMKTGSIGGKEFHQIFENKFLLLQN